MSQIVDSKCEAFVSAYAGALIRLLQDVNTLTNLNAEWTATGYATGAPNVDGTNFNITDAQVQAVLPAATAAMLNSAVGAVASVISTFNSNIGYLAAFQPGP